MEHYKNQRTKLFRKPTSVRTSSTVTDELSQDNQDESREDPSAAGSLQLNDDIAVDKAMATPMYVQIAQYLYRDIARGEPGPGAAIATENELIERFKVSRVTVRKAVDLLVEQGLLSRRHGRGTFVEAAPMDYPLDHLRGTIQVYSSHGHDWQCKVAEYRSVEADEKVARFLEVIPSERVLYICRVDHMNNVAVTVDDIYLPMQFGQRLTIEELEHRPLYPLLREKAGIVADVAFQIMRAAAAPRRIARFLGISTGDPIMVVERITKTADGRPLAYGCDHFRAEAIRFSVTLRRSSVTDEEIAFGFSQHRIEQ